MLSGHSVCVVVPAHNEALRIAEVLKGLPHYVDRAVVVDDASDDGTSQKAAAVGDPRVEVLRNERNCGVGAAIAAGYRWAWEQRLDIAVVMAGDGQMDPEDLPKLLAPVVSGKADYVKGNRFLWPGVTGMMPPERLLGNLALSIMTRATSGYPDIMDAQCGYTALRLSLLERVKLDELFPRYGYPNDLLALLHTAGAKVAQVAVRPLYFSRTSGLKPLRMVVPLAGILLRSGVRRVVRERLQKRQQE